MASEASGASRVYNFQSYQTPTDAWKKHVVELYEEAQRRDIDGDRRGYVNACKHLYRQVYRHAPRTRIAEINAQYELMKKEVAEKQKDEGLSDEQRAARILDVQYKFFDGLLPFLVEAIYKSRVIEQDVEGTIVHSDEATLIDYAHMVRGQKTARGMATDLVKAEDLDADAGIEKIPEVPE